MEPVTIWMWSLAAGGLVIVVVALLLLAIIDRAREEARRPAETTGDPGRPR